MSLQPSLVFILDPSLKISAWPQSCETLLGWPAMEILGHSAFDHLFEKCDPDICHALERVREKGFWTGGWSMMDRNGCAKVFHGHFERFPLSGMAPGYILVQGSAQTEGELNAQQLLRAQRVEATGMMVTGIVHGLNNALGPVLLALPVLKENTAPEVRSRILQIVERSARQGAALVKQVLACSRGLDEDRDSLEPKTLLKEILKFAKATFPVDVEIRDDFASDLIHIAVHPTEFYQLIMSLLMHAKDHIQDRGSLTLKAAVTPSPGETPVPSHLILEVMVESLEKPITPDDASNNPENPRFPWFMVPFLAERMKASVSIEDPRPNLRVYQVRLPGIAAHAASQTGSDPSHDRLEGLGVLVVDDEAPFLQIGSTVLAGLGAKPHLAASGADAIGMLMSRKQEISVALIDVQMPEMNGVETAEVLLELSPKLHIVLTSGVPKESLSKTIRGFQQATTRHVFLEKPYGQQALADALLKACQTPP